MKFYKPESILGWVFLVIVSAALCFLAEGIFHFFMEAVEKEAEEDK